MKLFLFLPLTILLLVGCASGLKSPSNSDPGSLSSSEVRDSTSAGKPMGHFTVKESASKSAVIESEELNKIPVEVNENVEKWIAYFQGRGRPHMERYLARSGRYMPLMQKILRDNGLPEDLIYIALIESGFSSRATSRAAAVGYWQFIRGTGRRYGLQINTMVDERRDPELSTQAAAAYFKDLYAMFGSWYLAMASYNVGEGRVKREVERNRTRDFWVLAARKKLPRETMNYVPKYLAAKLIAKNPAEYGFTEVEYEDPIEFDLIEVSHGVNLRNMAESLGVDYADFKLMNPKFRGEIAPPQGAGLTLRVPVGQKEKGLLAATQARVDKIEFIADAGETMTYRVRVGDSLGTIARKFRTTSAWLRDANDLKKGRKLRIGQRLQVPDRSKGKIQKSSADVPRVARQSSESPDVDRKAEQAPEVVSGGRTYYIVQRGDTLSSIAEEYDSTVAELRRMNKMSRRSVLRAGLRIRVPKVESLPSEPGQVEIAVRKKTGAKGERAQHIVKSGENLASIAKKYGVSVQSLIAANGLKSKAVLRVGRPLIIPYEEVFEGAQKRKLSSTQKVVTATPRKKKSRVHVVRRGENLTQIADKYGVTVQLLKARNELAHPKILVGMRLSIP